MVSLNDGMIPLKWGHSKLSLKNVIIGLFWATSKKKLKKALVFFKLKIPY